MNDDLKNLLITVISGVSVYVLSQWYTEFILRPIQEYKQLKAKAAKYLVFYAQYYSNPWIYGDNGDCTEWKTAENSIRELAAEVAAFAEIKPFHLLVFYAIPNKRSLIEAHKYLIGLSNACVISRGHITKVIRGVDEFPDIIRKNMRITHCIK